MTRNRFLILILVLMVALAGCQNSTHTANSTAKETSTTEQMTTPTESTTVIQTTEAPVEIDPTEIHYADEQIFHAIYNEEVQSLNYLVTATTQETGLAANFIDTLVDYNRYGQVMYSLAESGTCSVDGLVWTFKLREGVNWYTWDGKFYAETVAQDFVDALKYSFDHKNQSKTAHIAYEVIKNGKAYYKGRIKEFDKVGVKAIDKYTLQYTLEEPVPYFQSMLTYEAFFPVNGQFLAEQGENFGTTKQSLLYNGAYLLGEFEPFEKRLLVANPNYWDKANVHIESVEYQYNKKAASVAEDLFLKGEVSELLIGANLIDKWLADDDLKQQVRPATSSYYSYCYALNFDPHYDEAFAPEDWRIAVNNLNFRKAFFYGFDRLAALSVDEPYQPAYKINNTITPETFASVDGKDYVHFGDLAQYAKEMKFDQTEAKIYMETAKQELADKVDWPIKVVMPYKPDNPNNLLKAQVIKQQLENLFGTDTINLYITPYPPNDYFTSTRRAGKYSLMEVSWGPDYADPRTYTCMFIDGTYNFPELTTEVDQNGKNKYLVYQNKITLAEEEKVDLAKRYELYANAESYVLDNAWVIPYRKGGSGYVASLINPFERPFAPFGVSTSRWKGMHILAKPMTTEQFEHEKEQWQAALD